MMIQFKQKLRQLYRAYKLSKRPINWRQKLH